MHVDVKQQKLNKTHDDYHHPVSGVERTHHLQFQEEYERAAERKHEKRIDKHNDKVFPPIFFDAFEEGFRDFFNLFAPHEGFQTVERARHTDKRNRDCGDKQIKHDLPRVVYGNLRLLQGVRPARERHADVAHKIELRRRKAREIITAPIKHEKERDRKQQKPRVHSHERVHFAAHHRKNLFHAALGIYPLRFFRADFGPERKFFIQRA